MPNSFALPGWSSWLGLTHPCETSGQPGPDFPLDALVTGKVWLLLMALLPFSCLDHCPCRGHLAAAWARDHSIMQASYLRLGFVSARAHALASKRRLEGLLCICRWAG